MGAESDTKQQQPSAEWAAAVAKAVSDEATREGNAGGAGTPSPESASFELPDNPPLAPPTNAFLLRKPR